MATENAIRHHQSVRKLGELLRPVLATAAVLGLTAAALSKPTKPAQHAPRTQAGDPPIDLLEIRQVAVQELRKKFLTFPTVGLAIVALIELGNNINREIRFFFAAKPNTLAPKYRWATSGTHFQPADAVVVNIGLVALVAAIVIGAAVTPTPTNVHASIRASVWQNSMVIAARIAGTLAIMISAVIWTSDTIPAIWGPATAVTALALLTSLLAINIDTNTYEQIQLRLKLAQDKETLNILEDALSRYKDPPPAHKLGPKKSLAIIAKLLGLSLINYLTYLIIVIAVLLAGHVKIHQINDRQNVLPIVGVASGLAVFGWIFTGFRLLMYTILWDSVLRNEDQIIRRVIKLVIAIVDLAIVANETYSAIKFHDRISLLVLIVIIYIWVIAPEISAYRAWKHQKGWSYPALRSQLQEIKVSRDATKEQITKNENMLREITEHADL